MENNIASENTNPTEGAGKKKRGKFLKTMLWRLLALSILAVTVFVLFCYYFNYSSGYRAGKIMKFSKKGYVFKTWEGQIYLGTLTPDDAGIASKYWDFSVDRGSETVIKAIENAMVHKREVRLHYHEKVFGFVWRGETRYFVDTIDIVQ